MREKSYAGTLRGIVLVMAVAGLGFGSVGCSSDSNSKGGIGGIGGAGGGVAGAAGGAAGSAAGGAAGGVVRTAKQARGEYLVDPRHRVRGLPHAADGRPVPT